MKKELEAKLIEEFPTFFRDMYGDPRKTCMAWGCAHGDGWFDILYDLCKNLKTEAEKDSSTDFRFLQIKEKFARLTLYTSGGNKIMRDLVDATEDQSTKVCEECGSPGSLDESKYWILTLCDTCKAERDKRK